MKTSEVQTVRSQKRIGLRLLATLVLIVGLVMALVDYSVAFDGTLNQFHALRGLVWNIGAYTVARMLVWWS